MMQVLANLVVLAGWPGPQVRVEKWGLNSVNLDQSPPFAEIPFDGQ